VLSVDVTMKIEEGCDKTRILEEQSQSRMSKVRGEGADGKVVSFSSQCWLLHNYVTECNEIVCPLTQGT
jgi:hypothetical protein